jgi:riboflavin kinase / FMN adenylyltransferase
MEIVRDTNYYQPPGRTSLTIGNFDGIHLGHRKILNELVKTARQSGTISGVLTFSPHPLKILCPERAPRLITTPEAKIDLLKMFHIDTLLILKFDQELSQLSGEAFIRDILVKKLRVKHMLVGENFVFGHRRSGDVSLLQSLSRELDYAVHIVPQVVVRGSRVSSTWIRELIQLGRIDKANRLLGRYYTLSGEVVPGKGLGRRFLFPTLNLKLHNEIIPRQGVYITLSKIDGQRWSSVTNVGWRPTVGGKDLTVESHILETQLAKTPNHMELAFLHRLRDERKFDSLEALRNQIEIDCHRSSRFFRLLTRLRKTVRPACTKPS